MTGECAFILGIPSKKNPHKKNERDKKQMYLFAEQHRETDSPQNNDKQNIYAT